MLKKHEVELSKFENFINENISKPKVYIESSQKNKSNSYSLNQKKLEGLLSHSPKMAGLFIDAFKLFLTKEIFKEYLDQSKIKKNKDKYLNNIEAFNNWIDKLDKKSKN